MSFSARCLPAVLLTIFSLAASLCAQSTTKQTTKAPRGTISGRVTIKDKGAAGVPVSLRNREMMPFEPFLKATTDPDGFYRITNVSAGTYEIAPSAPAFVVANNNNSRSKSVVVGEDENVEGINFSLVRGGVITGKIVDADGHPIIQQQVQAFRAEVFERQTQQQRQIFPTARAQTDDRGIYRMYGLSPGRYKVGTGLGDDTFVGMNIPTRATYKQVFHPDVADQTKATIIEVSEGSEAKDVDIKLAGSMQTFSVSGRFVDGENGVPVPNVRFGLQRELGQKSEFVNSSVMTNERGDFTIEGLVPGKYGIYLFTLPNSEKRVESLGFDIVDQDVSGVIIKLVKGVSLSGIVVLDTEDKTALQKLQQMQLRAFVMPPGGAGGPSFGQSSASSISPDGSFRLAGLPAGTANISIGPTTPPFNMRGFAISRIERDGVVMPRGIEIKENEHIAGIRVIVSYGNASIRGVVKPENESPLAPGTNIFVRVMKLGEASSSLRPPQVDARGHFLMEGIPPGTYELIVTIGGGNGVPPTRVKREVSLQDGVVTDVVITFEVSKPPNP